MRPILQRPAIRLGAILSLLAATLGAVGCGGSAPATPDEIFDSRLRDVGEAYRVYSLSRKRPPRSVKELATIQNSTPVGLEAIHSGDVVVRWGTALTDTNEESTTPSDEILAYVKDVPEKGGKVLTTGRSIKILTAEEFKTAAKSGGN